ncbi:hypothetical protein VSR69_36030 [Paraburkholderia phytofirmans]|jgi:hypothetical protein|uniref:hypothetical protein n=1 Tax=Paraburkholderia sp. BL9I2N2 TaxID=1938809 RepID=UPI001052BCC6|nr:hypothetical protein [Paraburkholderia sp. BL9I2N2]TCK88551.1 hypothetical protein B0G74_6782 [Paraburkholderia sp. BL9I2N2]
MMHRHANHAWTRGADGTATALARVTPDIFDEDDPEHLRVFYDRIKECLDSTPGGMFRVVWGFSIIMSNDMVDPDLDYLAFHPRIVQALARPPAGAMTCPAEITPELLTSRICAARSIRLPGR